MPADHSFDMAVIGAGVVGLGCAWAAAKRGKSVVVIDRDAQANGASVRNFGFVTVTGQERGAMWRRARRTRQLWDEFVAQASLPVAHRGLVLAVRRPEAVSVLEAFLQTEMGEECRLLNRRDLERTYPWLARPEGVAALWSPHELRVESRDAIPRLSSWLEDRYGVRFMRETAALAVETSRVTTSRGRVEAEAIAVCPGDDLVSLFPECIANHNVTRCKLQMLRLEDAGFILSAGVMSDLGLARYAGFAALPQTEALRDRLAAEQPLHLRHGVHLIVVQSSDRSLVVGDSHHYAATPDPFACEGVDQLILEEFRAVFGASDLRITARWTGTYASAPGRTVVKTSPAPGVRLVMVTTGAGASTGFALGEETVEELFEGARHDM